MTLEPTRSETRPPLGISTAEAAGHVERLGFLDVNGTAPQAPGGANLVVALRERPTLAHFDPERIEFWRDEGGRGHAAEITLKSPVPFERPFEWGTIRVLDRLQVFNSFLTFGGTARGVALDATTHLIVFSSHAPILRAAGHSQQVDLSTGEVGAFFARMRIPIDFTPGAEQLVAGASAMTVYGAFHASVEARFGASEDLRLSHPGFNAWCGRERHRLAAEYPAGWEAGRALARELELDRP